MIGLDTNVLARYFTRDDEKQAAKASRLIGRCSSENPGYINLIVLAELFWLLDRRYKYKRDQQIALLQNMLQLDDLIIEASDDVYIALKQFGTNKVQLADCLIAARNQRAACETSYTFDKSASKMRGFELIR